eukprot:PhF_6_TR14902/c0_g1_i1/m.23257
MIVSDNPKVVSALFQHAIGVDPNDPTFGNKMCEAMKTGRSPAPAKPPTTPTIPTRTIFTHTLNHPVITSTAAAVDPFHNIQIQIHPPKPSPVSVSATNNSKQHIAAPVQVLTTTAPQPSSSSPFHNIQININKALPHHNGAHNGVHTARAAAKVVQNQPENVILSHLSSGSIKTPNFPVPQPPQTVWELLTGAPKQQAPPGLTSNSINKSHSTVHAKGSASQHNQQQSLSVASGGGIGQGMIPPYMDFMTKPLIGGILEGDITLRGVDTESNVPKTVSLLSAMGNSKTQPTTTTINSITTITPTTTTTTTFGPGPTTGVNSLQPNTAASNARTIVIGGHNQLPPSSAPASASLSGGLHGSSAVVSSSGGIPLTSGTTLGGRNSGTINANPNFHKIAIQIHPPSSSSSSSSSLHHHNIRHNTHAAHQQQQQALNIGGVVLRGSNTFISSATLKSENPGLVGFVVKTSQCHAK